jgi:hypothetical protein
LCIFLSRNRSKAGHLAGWTEVCVIQARIPCSTILSRGGQLILDLA